MGVNGKSPSFWLRLFLSCLNCSRLEITPTQLVSLLFLLGYDVLGLDKFSVDFLWCGGNKSESESITSAIVRKAIGLVAPRVIRSPSELQATPFSTRSQELSFLEPQTHRLQSCKPLLPERAGPTVKTQLCCGSMYADSEIRPGSP